MFVCVSLDASRFLHGLARWPVLHVFHRPRCGTASLCALAVTLSECPTTVCACAGSVACQDASSRVGTAADAAPYTNLTTYFLGIFIQDYAYTADSGDLDVYNGRFCVTPDYPAGTYAYFMTLDSEGKSAFPYIVGTQYYGSTAVDDSATGSMPPGCAEDACSSAGAVSGDLGLYITATLSPSIAPSRLRSVGASSPPTPLQTALPSFQPSGQRTPLQTALPSFQPSGPRTPLQSAIPSGNPTRAISSLPSRVQSAQTSLLPSRVPSRPSSALPTRSFSASAHSQSHTPSDTPVSRCECVLTA